jgi:hypothetical protein
MLHTYPTTAQIFEVAPEGLDIRPFPGYDAVPYCVLDWHLLALAWSIPEYLGEGPPPQFTFDTREEVWALLETAEATFLLDGDSVEVEETPIRQSFQQEEPLFRWWGRQWGRILAPDELSVGEHTLQVILEFSDGFTFDEQVTFTVHAADSAACTT